VHMEAGPLRQPGPDFGVLVGAGVVHHQMDVQIFRDGRLDLAQEAQELLVPVAGPSLALSGSQKPGRAISGIGSRGTRHRPGHGSQGAGTGPRPTPAAQQPLFFFTRWRIAAAASDLAQNLLPSGGQPHCRAPLCRLHACRTLAITCLQRPGTRSVPMGILILRWRFRCMAVFDRPLQSEHRLQNSQ
jgi:hypothetical protein